jgi:hypothetical protein
MRQLPYLCAAVALAVSLTAAAAAQLNMQPGLWEDEISAPDGAFHTVQKCYVQKDIDTIDAFQKGAVMSPDQSCRASDYKASGDTVTYMLVCNIDKQQTISQITATYHGTEVSGSVTKDGNVTRLTRRRIGDCSKSSISQ